VSGSGGCPHGWEAELSNRIVLRLMCDTENEISFLFGPWGAVNQAEAIRDIESGERSYTLQLQDGSRAPIEAIGAGDSKRLRAYSYGAGMLSLEDAPRISA
jgi:hypothetical protein